MTLFSIIKNKLFDNNILKILKIHNDDKHIEKYQAKYQAKYSKYISPSSFYDIENAWFDWFSGFTDGEGSFMVTNAGKLRFSIQLSAKDVNIIKDIKMKLDVGNVYYYSEHKQREKSRYNINDKVYYVVSSLIEINQVIIPIFKSHPLKTEKKKDFDKWCIVCEILKKNEHFTKEGKDKIFLIRKTMNLRGFRPYTVI